MMGSSTWVSSEEYANSDSAGDAGPDDPAHARDTRAAPRVRDRYAAGAGFRRTAEGEPGNSLSRARPTGAERMDQRHMGQDGEQPGGQVLRSDQGGTQGHGGGNATLAAVGWRGGKAADGGTLMRALLMRTIAKLRNLWLSHRADDELEREIALHVALLEEEYARRGLSEEAARTAARRALGGIEQARQAH